MAYLTSPWHALALDIATFCKTWTSTVNDSTDARMSCRASVMFALAEATNHILSRYPRVWGQHSVRIDSADTTGSDPLYRWRADDQVGNALIYQVNVVAVPRSAGAGDCRAEREGDAGSATSLANSAAAAVSYWDQAIYDSFLVARGAAAAAEIVEGLSTFNGYTVVSFSVHDRQVDGLHIGTHDLVDTGAAKKGAKVLSDIAEEIRENLHKARTENVSMAVQWMAAAAAGSWATPGATDQTAIVSTASGVANIENVLDTSVAARTATSPGVSCHCLYAGWGPEDETAGKNVKITVRVFAAVANGVNTGRVRFQGPDHIANNFVDITVTNGVAAAWYGSDSDYIMLDSTAADNDATTGRNKIDIFAWIDTARTTEVLYIYGLPCWQIAPL